jgi:photosystem II stability/assembly factor-like uncharacterized protein
LVQPSNERGQVDRATLHRRARIRSIIGCWLLVIASHAYATGLAPNTLLLGAAACGDAIVAVGERGTLVRSTDNARSWQELPRPVRATLTAISFAPTERQPASTASAPGWAVGHDAVILGSTDGGRTWAKQYQGETLDDSFLDVLAFDARRVIAVGEFGLYVESADAGQTWKRRKVSPEDGRLNRISRGPTGTLYLAGEHGILLRSGDHGATWTALAAPARGSFYGVLALDRRTLVAYGLLDHVYRSVDDGASWQPIATPQQVLLATALQLKSNTLVLAGAARTIRISRDYGKTFAPLDGAPATAIAALLELPGGGILALGEAGATVIRSPK